MLPLALAATVVMPLSMVLPMLGLNSLAPRSELLPWAALLLPSATFLLWVAPCFRDVFVPTRRTALAFALMACASLAYFIFFAWHVGVRFHGVESTAIVAAISLGIGLTLLYLLTRNLQLRSLPSNLAVNFLLVFWAFSFAFPYLGELP